MAGGPFGQVVAAVAALQKVRRAFKVPVDDIDEVRAVGQTFLQHAQQGRLALECAQTVVIEAELVDALLAGLAVFGQPHFAARRARVLSTQHKVGSTRHRMTDYQLKFTDQLAADRDPTDRPLQAIADARQGGYVLGIGLAQGAAQFGDRIWQHLVDGDPARPHFAQQLILGHRLAGMPQQVGQDLQCAPLDLDRQSSDSQLKARFVELSTAEAIAESGSIHSNPLICMTSAVRAKAVTGSLPRRCRGVPTG